LIRLNNQNLACKRNDTFLSRTNRLIYGEKKPNLTFSRHRPKKPLISQILPQNKETTPFIAKKESWNHRIERFTPQLLIRVD
jgi:hypothetical protein